MDVSKKMRLGDEAWRYCFDALLGETSTECENCWCNLFKYLNLEMYKGCLPSDLRIEIGGAKP